MSASRRRDAWGGNLREYREDTLPAHKNEGRPERVAPGGSGIRQAGKEAVIRSKQDIRKWMPGHTCFKERIAAPEWLKPGSAKVDVGIVEGQATSGRRQAASAPKAPAEQGGGGKARVKLAIEPVREDGWHPMGLVEVV